MLIGLSIYFGLGAFFAFLFILVAISRKTVTDPNRPPNPYPQIVRRSIVFVGLMVLWLPLLVLSFLLLRKIK